MFLFPPNVYFVSFSLLLLLLLLLLHLRNFERRRLVVGVLQVPPGSVDSVEFLVKPTDQIVLYRSVSRDTLFLYPLQQPVSDQGKLKDRLEGEWLSVVFLYCFLCYQKPFNITCSE